MWSGDSHRKNCTSTPDTELFRNGMGNEDRVERGEKKEKWYLQNCSALEGGR